MERPEKNMPFNWQNYALDMETYCDDIEDENEKLTNLVKGLKAAINVCVCALGVTSKEESGKSKFMQKIDAAISGK